MLAGVGRGERHALLARPRRLVKTVMNRLSPVSSRLPAPSSAPMMPALGLLAAVAEDGLHLDAGRHVHHRAGFGHGALARIELDLDELHVLADDLEVDVVRAAAGGGAERRRSRRAPASDAAANCGTVAERRPVRHARREHQRVRVDAAVAQIRRRSRPRSRGPPGARRLPCTTGLPLTCSCEEIERLAPRAAVGLGSRAATPSAVGRYDGCSAAPGPWAAAAAVIRSTAARSSSAAAAGSRPS